MMISNKRLEIFENFVVDRNLPKHKKENTDDGVYSSNEGILRLPVTESSFNSYLDYLKSNKNQLNLFTRLKIYFFEKWFPDFFDIEVAKPIDSGKVLEFFQSIKKEILTLSYDETTIDNYIKIIENAKLGGQTALIEKISDKRNVLLLESKLINGGFEKYIDEELVIGFNNKFGVYKNTYLKMSWIKNFARLIPQDVIDLKIKADDLKVFDNYVVLHYDKNNNQEEMTKKEKEDLKDPILFGVIENSNRLYYIGDWEDEFCDLTLDKLLKQMETEAKKVGEI